MFAGVSSSSRAQKAKCIGEIGDGTVKFVVVLRHFGLARFSATAELLIAVVRC